MKSAVKNAVATTLAGVFFLSHCVLAHSAETNFWNDRKKNIQQIDNAPMLASLPASMKSNPAQMLNSMPLPALSITSSSVSKKVKNSLSASQTKTLSPLFEALSSPHGTIRQVSLPSKLTANTKTIIHIQDVHQNAEAQQNIAQAVQKLIDSGKADLVALEGAFDEIDLNTLRKFPDSKATDMVADYLLREHRITGPVHAGLTSRSPIPVFVGVDDHAGYQANVDAYLQSTPQRDAQKRAIAQQKAQASEQKEKLFNAALKEFDDQAASYHAGVLPMGEYVRVLMKEESSSMQLNLFHETYELESRLNFSQVEAERNRVIAQLLEKLSKEETSDLVNHSIAYRLGNLNHTDFYEYLSSLCSKKGVVLSSYPAMKAYIQYVLMSDGIHPDVLMKDMAAQEQHLYSKLIQTNEERVLVGQLQTLRLQEKLLDFALTPDEWEAYKARQHGHEHGAWKNVPPYREAMGRLGGAPPYLPTYGGEESFSAASFERFYLEAERRNHSIAENLLQAMERHQSSVAVLVTGGFHTAGIDALLKTSDVATLTFVPTITKVEDENGSSYLSVFAREKTSLDRLFAGEKLFVTQPPAQLGGAGAMQAGAGTFRSRGINPAIVGLGSAGALSLYFSNNAIASVEVLPAESAVSVAFFSGDPATLFNSIVGILPDAGMLALLSLLFIGMVSLNAPHRNAWQSKILDFDVDQLQDILDLELRPFSRSIRKPIGEWTVDELGVNSDVLNAIFTKNLRNPHISMKGFFNGYDSYLEKHTTVRKLYEALHGEFYFNAITEDALRFRLAGALARMSLKNQKPTAQEKEVIRQVKDLILFKELPGIRKFYFYSDEKNILEGSILNLENYFIENRPTGNLRTLKADIAFLEWIILWQIRTQGIEKFRKSLPNTSRQPRMRNMGLLALPFFIPQYEGLVDNHVFSLSSTGSDVLDTAISFGGFMLAILALTGLIYLVGSYVKTKWDHRKWKRYQGFQLWPLLAGAIFILGAPSLWAQTGGSNAFSIVNGFPVELFLLGVGVLGGVLFVNKLIQKNNLKNRVKQWMPNHNDQTVALVSNAALDDAETAAQLFAENGHRPVFKMWRRNGNGFQINTSAVKDVLIQNHQGVKNVSTEAADYKEPPVADVVGVGHDTANAWNKALSSLGPVIVLGALAPSSVTNRPNVLWARSPEEIRWVKEAIEVQVVDSAAQAIVGVVVAHRDQQDVAVQLGQLAGEIGKLGIDGGPGLGQINPELRDKVMQRVEKLLSRQPVRRDLENGKESEREQLSHQEQVLSAQIARVFPSSTSPAEAGRMDYLMVIPDSDMDQEGYDQFMQMYKDLSAKAWMQGRKIVVELGEVDFNSMRASGQLPPQARMRKEKVTAAETKNVSNLIKRLFSNHAHVHHYIVVLPEGSFGFEKISSELREKLQVVHLSELLGGSVQSVNLSLMLAIYQVIKTQA
jgi:hypothetical protein